MNELKQIRSMAEMIIEKVNALEGAKPFPQNGFREFVPEPQFDRNRNGSLYDRGGADSCYGRTRDPHWYPNGTYKGDPVKDLTPAEVVEYNAGYDACGGPKFAVGDCVGTTVGDRGRITGIHRLDGHYRFRYLVLFDNGNHHHVAEPLLKLVEPSPKFAVGDRVHIVNQKNQLVQAPISRMAFNDSGCYVKGKWHYWFDRSEHNTDTNFIPAGGMPEHLLTKVENERVWHSGPPPHIGWWNASLTKRNDSWRWWNGSSWSEHVTSFNTAKEAHGTAMWVETAERNAEIKWTDYWPANARVPRVDPGVK